jgi:hypothetical protein
MGIPTGIVCRYLIFFRRASTAKDFRSRRASTSPVKGRRTRVAFQRVKLAIFSCRPRKNEGISGTSQLQRHPEATTDHHKETNCSRSPPPNILLDVCEKMTEMQKLITLSTPPSTPREDRERDAALHQTFLSLLSIISTTLTLSHICREST